MRSSQAKRQMNSEGSEKVWTSAHYFANCLIDNFTRAEWSSSEAQSLFCALDPTPHLSTMHARTVQYFSCNLHSKPCLPDTDDFEIISKFYLKSLHEYPEISTWPKTCIWQQKRFKNHIIVLNFSGYRITERMKKQIHVILSWWRIYQNI